MGAGLAFRLVAAVIFATVLLAFVALPRPCVCVCVGVGEDSFCCFFSTVCCCTYRPVTCTLKLNVMAIIATIISAMAKETTK